MDETDWLAWPVWGFMGSWATVVSLIAIAIAAVELIRQRRRVRPVSWGLDLFGNVEIDGDPYHVVDFYNAGSGTAEIISAQFVNARPFLTGEYTFRSVMGSGDRDKILLTSRAIATAWLFLVWRSHEDERMVNFSWMPVAQAGAMRDEWKESFDRTNLPRFSRLKHRLTTRPVGPQHYTATKFRVTKPKRNAKNFAKAWAPLYAPGLNLNPWSYPRGMSTPDLPFIPPPTV